MRNILITVMILMTICVFSNETFSQTAVVGTQDPDVSETYTPYFEISEQFAIIPGLKERLIPQGLAYIAEKDWFVISHYRSGAVSVLSFVDAATGEWIKSVTLSNEDGSVYTGHAGGVAVSRLNLWISSGSFLRRIPLQALYSAGNGESIRIVDKFNAGTNASFVTCNNDVLWVGEFFHNNDYLTDSEHYARISIFEMNHAWVTGFKLNTQSDLLQTEPQADENIPVIPDYILSIPDIVQGMAFSESGQIVLSESYGRNNDSTIAVYASILFDEPDRMKTVNGEEVPMWILSSKNFSGKVTALPMSENIVMKDGRLYILYESAGEKYLTTTRYATDHIWQMNLSLLE